MSIFLIKSNRESNSIVIIGLYAGSESNPPLVSSINMLNESVSLKSNTEIKSFLKII